MQRRRDLQFLLLPVLMLCARAGSAEPLELAVEQCRARPTPTRCASLEKLAQGPERKEETTLARMALGVIRLEQGRAAEAEALLKPLLSRIPALRDYLEFWIASAKFRQNEFTQTVQTLGRLTSSPGSAALYGQAVLLAAQASIQAGEPGAAVALLKPRVSSLPSPEAEALLASAAAASGDELTAAYYYQRVWFGYPASRSAATAGAELARLKLQLGSDYPPAPPSLLLERASKLLAARRFEEARKEYSTIIPVLAGRELEEAKLGLGTASYRAGRNEPAYEYLSGLVLRTPELDSQRLYYLVELARRLRREADIDRHLEQLARLYPKSSWRRDALLSAGNHYLIRNEAERFLPYYSACSADFPGEREGAYCDWKVVWQHWLRRSPRAASMFQRHLERFPNTEKAAAALYFLGREAESRQQYSAARAYYDELRQLFPNDYYAARSEERLNLPSLRSATPSREVLLFLNKLDLRERDRSLDFRPSAECRSFLERAGLLSRAGLSDYAEQELRFGSRSGLQPHVAAFELAKAAGRRGAYDRSIRYIKGLAPEYLHVRLDSAPEEFWRLAFPFPYRELIEKQARSHSLDPYLLAGLIRQESEFNPRAVSSAKARGLTQVLDTTGRQLSRKLGLRRFTAAMLYQPETNLKLGAYYFRSLLDSLNGKVEAALASYNAGRSRVVQWLTWGDYQEPAEFIETIPFTQTREYVLTVLRNAETYRKLYGADPHRSAAR